MNITMLVRHRSARRLSLAGLAFVPVALCLLLTLSCSTGLDDSLAAAPAPPAPLPTSGSPRFGLSLPGGVPTLVGAPSVIDDALSLTAGLLGTTPVAFVAFTTTASADSVLASLDPGGALDINGVEDVFVVALSPSGIEPDAFVHALGPVFRHPRCVTCHSMNATTLPSTAFQTGGGHPGGAPPLGDETGGACAGCHGVGDGFVGVYRAPGDMFDFRTQSQRDIFDTLINDFTPADLLDHLTSDPRIDWALGANGALPFGRVADDDHDGVLEPWDADGVTRSVPIGKAGFTARANAWIDAGQPFDDGSSVIKDVALVSHRAGSTAAGDARSTEPSMVFVPLAAPVGDLMGHLEIAFTSDATDLVAGDTNGVSDVFVVTVEVHFTEAAGTVPEMISLVPTAGGAQRASVDDGGNQASGASRAPSLGGLMGEVLAFQSLAGDLVGGFADGNGAAPDVFLRMLGTGMTRLVSHGPVLADGGVGGGSMAPRVSAEGEGIAFESDATSLVPGDTNGVRDVFYTLVEASLTLDLNRASVADGGVEGTGGDSRHGSIAVLDMATHDVRVVFESDKSNLITPAHGSTNAYLFDSVSGTTSLLNQRRDMGGTQLGTIEQLAAAPPIPASSFRPLIAPGGQFVLFDSDADNIDVIREVDESSGQDVFIADLNRFGSDGFVLPFRVSVDELGFHANAPSSAVGFGAFASGSGVFPSGLVAYVSDATNLGVPDGGRHLLSFVTETPVGNAAFAANPVTGPAPLMVTFTDASTGVIDGFAWDFGDGSNSTAQHPVHSYTKAGLYTVTLTIDGPFGMSQTVMTDLITVQ